MLPLIMAFRVKLGTCKIGGEKQLIARAKWHTEKVVREWLELLDVDAAEVAEAWIGPLARVLFLVNNDK